MNGIDLGREMALSVVYRWATSRPGYPTQASGEGVVPMMSSQECRLLMEAILSEAPREFRRWLRRRYRESDGLFDLMGEGLPEQYNAWEMEILHRLTQVANETMQGEAWIGAKDNLATGWSFSLRRESFR